MENIKQNPVVKKLGFNRIILFCILLLMYGVFSVVIPGFASMDRIMSILNYTYFLGFLALGVTFVIATGGIDFSIGPVMFCCALMAGYTLNTHGAPVIVSLIMSIVIGFCFGCFNGYLVAFVGVPPFIVSMATMNIAKGLGSVFTKTQSVSWPQGNDPSGNGWFRNLVKVGGVPTGLIVFVIAIVVLYIVMNNTKAGRYILCLGSNKEDVGMGSALRVANMIHDALTISNMNAWHFWWIYSCSEPSCGNGALWPQGQGNPDNVEPTKRLWVMGNYSRFARPGARRIDATKNPERDVKVTAYRDSLKTKIAVVILNSKNEEFKADFNFGSTKIESFKPYVTDDTLTRIEIADHNTGRIEQQEHHDRPVTFALSVQKSLSGRWSLETGVQYSLLSSRFSMGENGYNVRSRQRIHYLGLPLRMSCRWMEHMRLAAYSSAGAVMHIPVYGTMHTSYLVNWQSRHSTYSRLAPPLQWQLGAAVGVQYRLSPRCSLFAEPTFNWFIPMGSEIHTAWTERPVMVTCPLGIRFTW